MWWLLVTQLDDLSSLHTVTSALIIYISKIQRTHKYNAIMYLGGGREKDLVKNAVFEIWRGFWSNYLFDFSIFCKKEEEGEMKALQVQASKGLLSLEELPKPEVGSPTQKNLMQGLCVLPPPPSTNLNRQALYQEIHQFLAIRLSGARNLSSSE